MIKSLSCGIVIYDEIDEIQKLIPKLKRELSEFEVQWVFVLNHEQIEIRKWILNWIQSNFENVLCFENPSNNLGFARQLILEKCSHDYVYLTDPDIDIVHGNLNKLIKLAEIEITNDSNLNYIGFGGTVTHKSKNKIINGSFELMSKLSKSIPFAFQIQNHSELVAVDHLPACHLLLNRKIALSIGGFSSALSKCGEDLDFTHRAYNLNYRFIFLPTAQVVHWQNLSLARWVYKMFTLGRIQIPVQKMNYKKGLRTYRLIPVLILASVIAAIITIPHFLLVLLLCVLFSSVFSIGLFGFLLTFIAYSTGELFEIAWLFSEQKNEVELGEQNTYLQHQYYQSKIDNS